MSQSPFEIINTGVLPPVQQWGKINHIRQSAIDKNEKYYQGNPCKKNHNGLRLTKDGQCVGCRSILRKKYNNKNRERARRWELNKNFGINDLEYQELFNTQNGLCKICNNPEKVLTIKGNLKKLAVDHCHETGKIRGLLCYTCNVGIGFLRHNSELLRKAAIYCEAV